MVVKCNELGLDESVGLDHTCLLPSFPEWISKQPSMMLTSREPQNDHLERSGTGEIMPVIVRDEENLAKLNSASNIDSEAIWRKLVAFMLMTHSQYVRW